MKRILIAICILLLFLSGCTSQNKVSFEEQAYAYYSVFENLYAASPGLNTDSTYLVMDLTNAKLHDQETLIALMQDFCDENGYVLMLDTIAGLTEKGFIADLSFREGIVIAFDDVRLGNSVFITEAMKWRSGDDAVGAKYTVILRHNAWEIIRTNNSWMSLK